MFESKYSKLLTVLLIMGIVLIIGILVFLGIRVIKSNSINTSASEAVEQFQGNKGTIIDNTNSNTVTNTDVITPTLGIENIVVNGSSTTTKKETKQLYKGFPMVGTIEIPSVKIKYPVLESANKASMEVAVGILEGVGLNQVGNTTIAGHNYNNGTFFSNLPKVSIGDKVYITDESGKKVTYEIYNTYITSPMDSEFMERDTEGKREITLDTCVNDSKDRFLVFAREQ